MRPAVRSSSQRARAACLAARSARVSWRVGHVADQGVHEEELGLALDRGAAHRAHELLGDQFDEAPRTAAGSLPADGGHGAGPEAAADDGGVGEQRLALGG